MYFLTYLEDALLLPEVDISLQLADGTDRAVIDRHEVTAQ